MKMNEDEREEGEILTDYEDISSEEEEVLRKRIKEIEAKNYELEKIATLSDKQLYLTAAPEKENHQISRYSEKMIPDYSRVLLDHKFQQRDYFEPDECKRLYTRRPLVLPKKKRPKKRRRSLKCQLILSEDEFDKFDPLPSETEEDVELKLRLEALQSKQEIKHDLNILLEPRIIEEEHELRLIALKSAVVKKHEARKKRKEESRPYSPTDGILDNLDVPSPPVSVHNMDISPLTSPDAPPEDCQPVDMEISTEESKSPIFFTSSNGLVPENGTALPLETATELNTTPPSTVGCVDSISSSVKVDQNKPIPLEDSGVNEEEDVEQLRSLLLSKYKNKTARCTDRRNNIEIIPFKSLQPFNTAKKLVPKCGKVNESLKKEQCKEVAKQLEQINDQPKTPSPKEEAEDEKLRAVLLSKIKKPLLPIAPKIKAMVRTKTPIQAAKAQLNRITKTPSTLISELKSFKVKPVVICLRKSDTESDFLDSDAETTVRVRAKRLTDDNQSPLSIAMDSPVSSPATALNKESDSPIGHNFEEKLSEFLKSVRGSVKSKSKDQQVIKLVKSQDSVIRTLVQKKNPTTPLAVKHLPLSTQIEYKRLVSRMRLLERQKHLKVVLDNNPKPVATKPTVAAISKVIPKTPIVQSMPKPIHLSPKKQRFLTKERLQALSDVQKKMLMDAQQRKLDEKRKSLSECLDKFLGIIAASKRAHRVQIKQEIELTELRKLVAEREKQLADQKRLCHEKLHKRLQDQNKLVQLSRKGLATVSQQYLEIGRTLAGENFRNAVDLETEGVGPKLKRYRETIASYKELKQKIAKRIFDVEDAKEVTVDIGAVILPDEESALLGDLRDDEDTRAKLMMVSYRSPLDHLANFESSNPDGIVCPFELNGSCQDDECAYKHLSS